MTVQHGTFVTLDEHRGRCYVLPGGGNDALFIRVATTNLPRVYANVRACKGRSADLLLGRLQTGSVPETARDKRVAPASQPHPLALIEGVWLRS